MKFLVALIVLLAINFGINIYSTYQRYEEMKITEKRIDNTHEEIMRTLDQIDRELEILAQHQHTK